MLDIFAAFQSQILKRKAITIDNAVFKLHYRVTVLMLIIFSILVTSRQYIGDPINCMTQSAAIPANVLDQYCWIATTFTLPDGYDKRVGVDVPHPGIDKSTPDEERTYHQYYQWVCFVLFLQAAMFYVPHYVWKIWEGGRMNALAVGLEVPLITDGDFETRKAILLNYFKNNLHCHNFYFYRYFTCEILNLINVVGQIAFTNRFLGGAFASYGSDVVRYSEMDHTNRTDPMVKVFPRVTKCIFYTFGTSGDVQKIDALCILPLNIINEKIYIFLWFWFVILSIISSLAIIYHLAAIAFPQFRLLLLKIKSKFSPHEFLVNINKKIQVGDWFVLYQLGKCVESRSFALIIADMAKKLDGKQDNTMI